MKVTPVSVTVLANHNAIRDNFRQAENLQVALRAAGPLLLARGSYSHLISVFLFVGRRTDIFAHFLIGAQRPSRYLTDPRCCIGFRSVSVILASIVS